VKKFLMRLLILVAVLSFGACGNPLMDFTENTDPPGGGGIPDPDTTESEIPKNVTPIYIDTQDEFNKFCRIGESGNDYPLDGYYILRGNGVADRTFHTNNAINTNSEKPFTGTLTGWYMDEDRKTTVKVDMQQSLFTARSLQAEGVGNWPGVSWLKFEATQSAYTQEMFGIVAQETTGNTTFNEVTVMGTVKVSPSGTGDIYAGGIVGKAGQGTTFTNCLASASITVENSAATSYVGGIAGLLEGTVNNSVVSVRIPPSTPAGQPYYNPTNVSSTVTGSSNAYAGGVAGKLTGTITKNTIVRATVTAKGATGAAYGGGFAGLVEGGNINGNNNSNISSGTLTVTATSGVNESGEAFAGGLAGASNSALVNNHLYGTLTITSEYYSIASYSGGLVGKLTGGNIEGSSVNAYATIQSVSQATPASKPGKAYAGGLAGYIESECSIKNSSFTNKNTFSGGINAGFTSDSSGGVTVAATEAYAGGIAGYAEGTISEVYAIADVDDTSTSIPAKAGVDARATSKGLTEDVDKGIAAAGGIVGKNTSSIEKSYAVVTVKARGTKPADAKDCNASAGGISGINSDAIANTFAFTRVAVESSDDAYAGGITGLLDGGSSGSVKTSYAAGVVYADAATADNAYAGGIVGKAADSVTIDKCVALQRYVESVSTNAHRVIGNTFAISDSYAYKLMGTSPNSHSFPEATSDVTTQDGKDIDADEATSLNLALGNS
jgi:hypothetical protein